jgi:hypothetical protein
MKRTQLTLNPVLSKKHIWDYLLGLPLEGHWIGWDSYGEWIDDNTRSYYMTGKFGFRGAWHCGRVPNDKMKEALHFAHEECDTKEKWKRMVIWNRLYECNDERLRQFQAKIVSERGKHVISKLLKLNGRVESARSPETTPRSVSQAKHKAKMKKQKIAIKSALNYSLTQNWEGALDGVGGDLPEDEHVHVSESGEHVLAGVAGKVASS